ncbi:hypothetical protein [Microcoleus sp. herbarium7]|uniref:hypothetical protein n=1 Tax=Microcoleus sp. herbarium7 TaxID=3055435 RepID=UPI003FA5BBFF
MFQSLVGIYGFSGRLGKWLQSINLNVSIPGRDLWVFRQDVLKDLPEFQRFQSLVGIYGFSGRRYLGGLKYKVFKVQLRLNGINIPFHRSPVKRAKFQINLKLYPSIAFSICV